MKMLILVSALLMSNAFAMGGKSKEQRHGEEFRKELNLTPEQVEKFQALKKNRADMKGLKDSFKESKKAFKDAMKDPKVSNQELSAKFEVFMKLRDEFQRKRFAHMLEKRAILTPDQLAKFTELQGRWHKGKKKGW